MLLLVLGQHMTPVNMPAKHVETDFILRAIPGVLVESLGSSPTAVVLGCSVQIANHSGVKNFMSASGQAIVTPSALESRADFSPVMLQTAKR